MEDGILVVIKAKSCAACIHLTKNSFFDSLLEKLDIKDVVILELDDISGFDSSTEGHEVYNIDPWYPSFKYMTIATHENIGRVPTSETLSRICLYNGDIVNGKYIKVNDYSGLPTLETIQDFCDRSALLLSKKHASVSSKSLSKPLTDTVSPKYKRKY
jgi:hypothetical protein